MSEDQKIFEKTKEQKRRKNVVKEKESPYFLSKEERLPKLMT